MNMMLRRPITSGSRQAPDPFDQFLESRGMYRKHTARDASSLFRVIAEQMYDTQMLHYEVRLECVRFMTRKRRIFEHHVRGDFDSYMLDMAKPKTYGTMLELRALCCMYRRNVILFEPYNLGTAVTYNRRFQDDFRVFYTNEYHFDSVYTVDYIELAAICQSICFKLLYKMLYKLPDVSFAVETMLHPQTFNWNNYETEIDARGYITRVNCYDGRIFELDLPENTKCILENYKLCQFHNNPTPQHQQSGEMSSAALSTISEATTRRLDLPAVDSLELMYICPHRLNSCVRQLLDGGITPFPYKVAKSLDPYMYRNIEFDSWNDARKEAKRFNVYANDYSFKVGAKCNVELQIDYNREMFTCHIQKIGADKSYCVVYVEKFAKKYLVPYDSLHPVPPDEFRPWTVSYRLHRQMQRVQLAKLVHKPKLTKWKKAKLFDMDNYFDAGKCEGLQYLHPDNCYSFSQLRIQQQQQHQIEGGDQHHQHHPQHQQHQQKQQQQQQQHQREQRFQARSGSSSRHQQQAQEQPQQLLVAGGETSASPLASSNAGQFVNYMPMAGRATSGQVPPPWLGSPEEFPAGVYPGPQMPANGCMMMHFGGFAPPSPPSAFAASQFMFGPQPQPLPGSIMLPPTGSSNITTGGTHPDDQSELRRSMRVNGEDLPADLDTLRYFYKIGVDAHMRLFNANNQNYHNTDQQQHQQQQQQQQQKQRNEDCVGLVANSTPPPSPDAVPAIGIPITTSTATPTATGTGTGTANTSTTDLTSDKARGRNKRDTYNNKGGRGKQRPEQLYDLNKDSQLSHVMMLPTPTPSPNTNNNQFNFHPSAQALLPTPPAMPLRPPIFYAAHKGGQNPYAWGMPPPPGATNMVGMPFEMVNNHNMDPNAVVSAAQPQQQAVPAAYMPTRH